VTFSAAEDLGNGIKASVKFTLGGIARDAGAAGENATLALSGGFGTVSVGSVESGSGIRARASAGAPVNNLEGEVLGAASNIDIVSYTSPKIAGGLSFTANYVDRGESNAADQADASVASTAGFGTGSNGGANGTPSNSFGVVYAAGPLSAAADITRWWKKAAPENKGNTLDQRYRLSASYDLGVVKVGAGYEQAKTNANRSTVQTMFGVSVPMGPITLGAVSATLTAQNDGAATKLADKSGYSIGANYALSKRTYVQIDKTSYKDQGTQLNNAETQSKFNFLVGHTF